MSEIKKQNGQLKQENKKLKEELSIRDNTKLQKEISASLKEIREGKCIVI